VNDVIDTNELELNILACLLIKNEYVKDFDLDEI
jgi:hypothetical protein